MDKHIATLHSGVKALRLVPDRDRIQRLLEFVILIKKWNRVFNLTALKDIGEMIIVHLLDSLSIHPYIYGSRVLDVGTGAGLPGIPLSIYYPKKQFVLLDSSFKKTRFLRQAVIELKLSNVNIERVRVEDYSSHEGFDIVVTRAFSSIAQFVSTAGKLCKPTGKLLAMKGDFPHTELMNIPAEFELKTIDRLVVPGLKRARHVVVLDRV